MTEPSDEVLTALRREHAFDPVPIRRELYSLHVPFDELVPDAQVEESILDAIHRFGTEWPSGRSCRGGPKRHWTDQSTSRASSRPVL